MLNNIPRVTFPLNRYIRITRVQPVVLLLLVLSAAMLLPIAHAAVHGEDRLARNFDAGSATRGPMSPGLASAARQAAENRISVQPVLQPFNALLLILIMAACAWLLCRWRTVRIPFGTALRAAVLAFAEGQLFNLILYFKNASTRIWKTTRSGSGAERHAPGASVLLCA